MVHQSHPDIVKRLKRAEGHLHHVIAMLENASPCVEVATQLHAVEAAVISAKRTLIHDHIDHCLADAGSPHHDSPAVVLDELRSLSKLL